MPCESKKESFEPLPYHLDYMTDDLKRRSKSELSEDEDTRELCIKHLKSLLNEEKGLHWQDDENFLMAYLRAKKFDVNKACSVVKNFYTSLKKHGELYDDFEYSKVKRTVEECRIGFLPYRDQEGCCVLVFNSRHWNPQKNSAGDIIRAATCGLLDAIRSPSTQVAGFKLILDLGGLSLKHLALLTPTYILLIAEIFQNCFPGRFRAVHVVDENFLINSLWAALKQFLGTKMKGRFYFHGKNKQKLHKYIDPSILPAEYGGEQPEFNNSEWSKHLELTSDYLTTVFSHGYKKKNNKYK